MVMGKGRGSSAIRFHIAARRCLFSAKKDDLAQRYQFSADNRTASAEDTLEAIDRLQIFLESMIRNP